MRQGLQIAHKIGKGNFKGVGDELGGRDAGREPPGLKLSEVLGVHRGGLVLAVFVAGDGGDVCCHVLQRALLGLSVASDGLAESQSGGIGV